MSADAPPADVASTPAILRLHYCFEIEFLVAKELTDIEYVDVSDNSDDSLVIQRWVCPADEQDPYRAILTECKNLLVKNNEPVAVCYDPSCPDAETKLHDVGGRAGESHRFGYWHLEPAVTARAKTGSPASYDWFGVRLRSPLLPYNDMTRRDLTSKWVVGAMRLGLLMHVNSTCRFNVQIQPTVKPLSLLAAKKLTTLVWLMEKEMFLRICPHSQGVPFPHVKPLDTHSRISTASWMGREDSRPEDPLRAGIMDQHLPRLRDKVMQERLHSVWGTATMEELSKALSCNDGQPASFAIRVFDQLESAPSDPPTIQLGYSLWHPYSGLDVSRFWIGLAVSLFRFSCIPAPNFKGGIKAIDDIIKGFSSQCVPASARWKILLDQLELTEDWSTPWEKIIDHYTPGRKLGDPTIDKWGFLGQIDELKIYEQ